MVRFTAGSGSRPPHVHEPPPDKYTTLTVRVVRAGIWDVMSNQECGDAVRQLLAEGERDMGLCAEELLMMCLDLGSKDNMSAIVVAFPAATYGPGPGVAQRMAARAQREAEADAKEAAAAR
jgi:hypothetical protein